MKRIRKFRIVEIFIFVVIVLACQQTSVTGTEAKMMNNNLNKTLDLNAMAIKVEELRMIDMYTAIDTYIGDLTAYVADCPLCSGRLACTGYNALTNRTIYFNDKDYGNVRIVASSRSLPCGSIVRFNLPSVSNRPITAIVLDRGVLGTDLDILMETREDALRKVGRRQISYDILRLGYER